MLGRKFREASRTFASATPVCSFACRYSGLCRRASARRAARSRVVGSYSRLSRISIAVPASSAIAVLRATRAVRSAFRALIRSTLAFATSTSARTTVDRGCVPTSKKPFAEVRLRSARSTACSCTRIRRWASRMLVYASFTVRAISWRWSSTPSADTSASLRAAWVAARVFPKSKSSWDSWTCARKVSAGWRLIDTATVRRVVVEVDSTVLLLRVADAVPESCGRSGASASRTRARGRVVVERGLDQRLGLERDRDALVDGEDSADDDRRGPLNARGGWPDQGEEKRGKDRAVGFHFDSPSMRVPGSGRCAFPVPTTGPRSTLTG